MSSSQQGTSCPQASALFFTLFNFIFFFSPKPSFSPLLISCHLWRFISDWRKIPHYCHCLIVVGATRLGSSIRLFWIVISAKPFKASVACKEYSAVFLSLWINKDKTAIRIKCPARLSVWLMLNPKGRGVRGNQQQQQLILMIVSAEALVKSALCPQAVDVPKV